MADAATNRPPWARGQCDRCGDTTWRLNQLRAETYDGRLNGLLVCPDCLDKDHPQLQLGRVKVDDAQSLFNPRPDRNRDGSTGLFGWKPIGNPSTRIECSIGDLTVTTS